MHMFAYLLFCHGDSCGDLSNIHTVHAHSYVCLTCTHREMQNHSYMHLFFPARSHCSCRCMLAVPRVSPHACTACCACLFLAVSAQETPLCYVHF